MDVDFEESGSQSLLVIMASKKLACETKNWGLVSSGTQSSKKIKYASFNFGKEIFCCGK